MPNGKHTQPFFGLIRLQKCMPVPLGPPEAANNRKFQTVRRDLQNPSGAILSGLWIRVEVLEPRPTGRCNDKYGLFTLGNGGQPTRILQVEVYECDQVSHRDDPPILGPHVHYYDANGNECVRPLRYGNPGWRRERWFRLFLCLINTKPIPSLGQLNLLGGMLPWP